MNLTSEHQIKILEEEGSVVTISNGKSAPKQIDTLADKAVEPQFARLTFSQEGHAEVDADKTRHHFWVRVEVPVPVNPFLEEDTYQKLLETADRYSELVLEIKDEHARAQEFHWPEPDEIEIEEELPL